jgi:uncharacterized protein YukE
MTPTDRTPGCGRSGWSDTIRVDDPCHLTKMAAAFAKALQALSQARSHFAAGAQGMGHDLGDATLSSPYEEVYRQTLGTLDAVEHCFEEFFRALSCAGTGYEETDRSLAGRMR